MAAYTVLFVWAVMVYKCKDDGWAVGWFVGGAFALSLALSAGVVVSMWLLHEDRVVGLGWLGITIIVHGLLVMLQQFKYRRCAGGGGSARARPRGARGGGGGGTPRAGV